MKTIDIIIETPKGSSEKYSLDDKTGYFKLKKILPAGMVFPYDFGFIPHTRGEDKDPLDALVISEFKSFPACIMECRLIGAILAEQTENGKAIRNDRYFFIPALSKQFSDTKFITDLPKKETEELESFFVQYNRLEKKEFKIIETINAKKALKLIKKRQ